MTAAGSVRSTLMENGSAKPLSEIEPVEVGRIHGALSESLGGGARLMAFLPVPGENFPDPIAIVADDGRRELRLWRARLSGPSFPSLSARFPQAQAFERELFECLDLVPEGHPWLKPLRRHRELEVRRNGRREAPPHPFFSVDGEGTHEVAVGPVHAGIIEPGHFRFQCLGENVLNLEIQLGYQSRAALETLLQSSPGRRLIIAESIAGDTAIGHAWAHCRTVEALSGVEIPPGAEAARAVALEIERLANHAGDLGAMSADIGHLPGASWFGRLRGDFLNLLMEWSGNRFGRGLILPGGTRFGLDAGTKKDWRRRLERARRDFKAVGDIVLDTPSVMSRFETTGRVSLQTARELGLVGVVARASGVNMDARRDHPLGFYRTASVPVATSNTGDVLARAKVRREEALHSIEGVLQWLDQIPGKAAWTQPGGLRGDRAALAVVEGWRGEIVHAAATNAEGNLAQYQIVDPSFHNWFGLAVAVRGNGISDFPLCNKSFNLSYAGHDL